MKKSHKQQQKSKQKQQQQGHPYGVQPWGNFYLKDEPDIRTAGLGLLAPLSDDLLLGVLYLLPGADLARLGLASKALYCFAHTTDLWKALAIQELAGDFSWCGSWRETYLCHKAPRYVAGSHVPLAVRGFYSDFLHQPWACANVELQPAWLEVDNIDRRAGLTPAEFRQQYECANRPVVLSDAAAAWPALALWSREYLTAALAGRPVIVGNMPWRFSAYMAYCDNGADQDEMPLYLFDKAFACASPQLAGDYSVPGVFAHQDLFEVLGEEGRPDYRWLIVGPARSGSSFHVDPNATCAWNAVVRGRKKWIMFPPGSPPPGVYPSPDGADVAAPVSLIEWLLNFYDEARASKSPPIEAIVSAGEVIYIPRGWWHMALNLEEAVAVTHNYVSAAGLGSVLAFLRPGRQELVSGCCMEDRSSLHDRFVAALQQQQPEVLEALQQQQQAQQQQREAEHRLCQLFKAPQQQQGSGGDAAAAAAGFSFGFGFPDGGGADAAGGAAGSSAAAGQAFSFGFSIPPNSAGDSAAGQGVGETDGQQQENQEEQKGQGCTGKRGRQQKAAEAEQQAGEEVAAAVQGSTGGAAAAAGSAVAKRSRHGIQT